MEAVDKMSSGSTARVSQFEVDDHDLKHDTSNRYQRQRRRFFDEMWYDECFGWLSLAYLAKRQDGEETDEADNEKKSDHP